MSELRDYEEWHRAYDVPGSDLTWRLRLVQDYLRTALDERSGPLRVLSVCSGDGRDLVEVLADRGDAERVTATLLELHPTIAQHARDRAENVGLTGIEVRTVDAGDTDSYRDALPADVVLLVGIFGNITDADVQATIMAAPSLCAPGATLLWSRGRHENDRNDLVRGWFAEAGFVELDYATREEGSRPALGAMRYDGEPVPCEPGRRLFTFVR
ncbi:MAG: SAM-dependent methyltransferase [Propionibacteriaceae bacterium]